MSAASAVSHDLRYSAFLSYCRGDVVIARSVQASLERYRLPRRLQAHNDAWDPARRRLKPLFRDLDEMTAAPDINTAVREAMAASRFLVVLCSPRAAQSEWVGREIGMFRALHGDGQILAALVEGLPATAFHPALLRGGDGGELLQPLAADFRKEGDGPRLALLKLVAVMAGVGLGELVQRDAQRRMRQMGIWALGTVAVLLVVLAAVVVTMNARVAAERERARGGALSGYMLDELRGRLKSAGRLDLLTAANRGVDAYYRGQDLRRLSEPELEQRAKLLLAMGEDDEKRGDLVKARENIEEARRTTARLLAAAPGDAKRIFGHAQSEYYVGMINWRLGDRRQSQAAFEAYLTLAERLLRLDDSKAESWMEVGYAEHNLGTQALRSRGDIDTAEGHFRRALSAVAQAAKRQPGDAAITSELADLHGWLGDTQRLSGNLAGALTSRQEQRKLLETLAVADPRDRVVQVDLVGNLLAMARIASAGGDLEQAAALLETGRAAAAALASEDPDNVGNAVQVRIFDLFKVRTWMALPAALRPSDETLAAANGDCEADRIVLRNEELAKFCKILETRRNHGAESAAADPGAGMTANGDRFSARWGLDFKEEARN